MELSEHTEFKLEQIIYILAESIDAYREDSARGQF